MWPEMKIIIENLTSAWKWCGFVRHARSLNISFADQPEVARWFVYTGIDDESIIHNRRVKDRQTKGKLSK